VVSFAAIVLGAEPAEQKYQGQRAGGLSVRVKIPAIYRLFGQEIHERFGARNT
jgi:hypothetical protein